VTNFNKHEFVDLKCEWLAYKQVQEQLEYLKKGFNKIIEHEWISFMTADELEA
jgi:E3 ubiquitin-protein ligase NEDD4